jgi:hypothetical protein
MERAVLSALGSRQLTTYGVAVAIFGTARPHEGCMDSPPANVTVSQMVSLRRAIRSLERRGLVTVDRHDPRWRHNLIRGRG